MKDYIIVILNIIYSAFKWKKLNRIFNLFGAAPFIGIERRRIGSDGDGVTTLVGFHGCNLRCKYCLNPQSITTGKEWRWYTPKMLYKEIRKDEIYFNQTGGGICFGGGEPLKHADFIRRFKILCNDNWKITIETSLNVSEKQLYSIIGIVDKFIIDIKDMNSYIYKSYTGVNNTLVLNNLQHLISKGYANKIIIRVPSIAGFNSETDIQKSMNIIQEMGIDDIEQLTYLTTKAKTSIPDENSINVGKMICNYLKSIRADFAQTHNINYQTTDCTYQGFCIGTCPACESELKYLTKEYHKIIKHNSR